MAIIDLYTNNISAPCHTVLLVANQLKIKLNKKQINLQNNEHLTPEFLKLNPYHCVPTIDDNGYTLWESRAIAQYLCNKYAPDSDLYPKDPKERAQVDRALNFDIGTVFPAIRDAIIVKLMRGVEPAEEKVENLKKTLKLLDQSIGSNGYLATNHLTIADLSLMPGTLIFTYVNYDLSDYPHYKEWYERLQTEVPYFTELSGKAKEEFLVFAENIRKKRANNQ